MVRPILWFMRHFLTYAGSCKIHAASECIQILIFLLKARRANAIVSTGKKDSAGKNQGHIGQSCVEIHLLHDS